MRHGDARVVQREHGASPRALRSRWSTTVMGLKTHVSRSLRRAHASKAEIGRNDWAAPEPVTGTFRAGALRCGRSSMAEPWLVMPLMSVRSRPVTPERIANREQLTGGHHEKPTTPGRSLPVSRPQVSAARRHPSETGVKRGHRVVHGDKELLEKLGRNDPCPCRSARSFQAVLPARWRLRRRLAQGLSPRLRPMPSSLSKANRQHRRQAR